MPGAPIIKCLEDMSAALRQYTPSECVASDAAAALGILARRLREKKKPTQAEIACKWHSNFSNFSPETLSEFHPEGGWRSAEFRSRAELLSLCAELLDEIEYSCETLQNAASILRAAASSMMNAADNVAMEGELLKDVPVVYFDDSTADGICGLVNLIFEDAFDIVDYDGTSDLMGNSTMFMIGRVWALSRMVAVFEMDYDDDGMGDAPHGYEIDMIVKHLERARGLHARIVAAITLGVGHNFCWREDERDE